MLVNSVNDRETPDFTAMDYIDTIANMLRHFDIPVPMQTARNGPVIWETTSFITHLVYLEGCAVPVDEAAVQVGTVGLSDGLQLTVMCRSEVSR